MKKGLRCLLRWLIIWGLMLVVLFLISCFIYWETLAQVLIAYATAFVELLFTIFLVVGAAIFMLYCIFSNWRRW